MQTPKPMTFDGNIIREMTDVEYADYQMLQSEALSIIEAAAEQVAAKESAKAKLTALGLTEAEVNAIIGGI